MPHFEFKAFTQEGEVREGILKAKDKDEALRILQEKNLLVTFLQEKKRKPLFFQRANLKDIYLFTHQLSRLLRAQVSIDEAIKSLSETTSKAHLREILVEIYNDLISGVKFSFAISKFPDLFDDYYVGMVRVGETAGILDEILIYVANYLEGKIKSKNRIIQAMIYPIIILIIFVGIIIALFYYVIPQITNIFIENNIPLPKITSFFQQISNFLQKFGLFLIVILGSLIYYTFEYAKTREGKVAIFNFVGNAPVFGSLIRNIYVGQFLESLHYLLRGGVSILESLEIVKNVINHPLYEKALDYIIEEAKKGRPLSSSIAEFPDLFPSIVVEAFKVAEKTGQLTEVSRTILDYYNETINAQLNNLSEAIQPFLIIILAGGLGALEISLLVPLLNLTKYVQNF
jgi:type IV pilus assembly protein PilC